ncbi:hypothetical protein GUJ93_ZPchr0011g28337 [Zizania palustris]|uniref:Uncharacterized protein n=1 Tax=Zizania palustris TaxID=103762 RepID=A0A8J5WIH7_ZIZPA|nr:hypothetical protein GUJ93_ZPchr0011g28337 [Zizania palustris]
MLVPPAMASHCLVVAVAVAVVLVASVLHAAAAATTTMGGNNSTEAAAATTTTAYDVLEKNNLPRGILPQGVQSYVLRPDGSMEVTLPGECNFFVDLGGGNRYKLRYGATVGGIVQAGSIREAYGVRMQVEYAWLGFNGVRRSGDQLELQVQEFTQSFPVGKFAVSPKCN